MKRAAVLLALLFLCSSTASGQEYTLVKGELDSGGFGAVMAKVTEVQSDAAAIVGLRGGWIIDHVFVLGGGFYGLASDVSVGSGGSRAVDFGYGGLELEYIGDWRQVTHWTAYILIGGGSVEHQGASDAVFVFEPALNLEVNVTTFLHIGVGVGYRVVAGVTGPELSNNGMSGVLGSITLKFGSF